MFLNKLSSRNPALIDAALILHQQGLIPSNSYVLDVDTMAENARLIQTEATRLGLTVFAMTKQFGRNPIATQAVMNAGLAGVVAVDLACALPLAAHGIAIGHIGHLVQIPRHEADVAAALDPAYWTVFSEEKAEEAAAARHRLGQVQPLLARVHGEGDHFYWGHEGGFPVAELGRVATTIDRLAGAEFGGVTTFPALLFDAVVGRPMPTHNLTTVSRAAELLGRNGLQVNAPGTTSTLALQTLADAGATQVEPGHALTGTTPWHALEDLPETPAMAYVSEVSHRHGASSFAFGGGLYIDPVFPDYEVQALVGRDPSDLARVAAEIPAPAGIDYYAKLSDGSPGDTVIFGFRAQAFVTRAYVVPITGLSTGEPEVAGVWNTNGSPAAHLPTRPATS